MLMGDIYFFLFFFCFLYNYCRNLNPLELLESNPTELKNTLNLNQILHLLPRIPQITESTIKLAKFFLTDLSFRDVFSTYKDFLILGLQSPLPEICTLAIRELRKCSGSETNVNLLVSALLFFHF